MRTTEGNTAQRSHLDAANDPPDRKGKSGMATVTQLRRYVTPGERRDDLRVTRRLPTASSPPGTTTCHNNGAHDDDATQ